MRRTNSFLRFHRNPAQIHRRWDGCCRTTKELRREFGGHLKDQAEITPDVQFQERMLYGLDDLSDQLLFCGQQRLPLFELGTRLRMSADCRYLRLRVRLDLCHLFFSLCFCRRQDLGRFFFRRSLGFLGVGFGVVNDLGDDFL